MDSLEERVGRFSSAELDLFKKQLPLRLKELGETERNTALERLSGIPQLSDLFQPQAAPAQPTPQPAEPQGFGQQLLSTITAP
ncbi:hypothetical protein LCGC14_1965930, partial [marine sediment metagenome]